MLIPQISFPNIEQLFEVFEGIDEQAEIKNNTINNELIFKIFI